MGRQRDVMNLRRPSASQYQYHAPPENANRGLLKGPRRVACFCLLAVVLPCVLVSVALLMRFVVHGKYVYHLSPSDMRILDQRISTIWCQSEKVTGNTSFRGYMTDGEPELIESTEPQIIQRNLIVPDDHKEYWGFYLLRGSTFRIHTCARWKGGTLLIVRGRNHLEHCAYVGEADSAAGDSDQFSASDSGEEKKIPGASSGPGNPLYNSKEEISAILSKIRQYIRSRPKNYQKLKKNLADWMLLESRASQEKSQEFKLNVSSAINSVESNFPSSLDLLQEMASSMVKSNFSDIQRENITEENDLLEMEHGTIRRDRRQTEIRKASESGENGAFENETSLENEILDNNETKTNEKKSRKLLGSIWETEHGHHQGTLNGTDDPNDGSNSESESSWSSSEEAMAKCEGVLASFNIVPNASCGVEGMDEDGSEANSSLFPYYEGKVNVSGYYYFIFGSENEKRDNLIRARFELDKFVYNLPEPMENCTDVRECRINLQFASNQKLVIRVPQPPPNLGSIWDEVYVVESECEPRTSLYLIFVLTVPLVILLCAFQ